MGGLQQPSSAPRCGHSPERGFMEYTLPYRPWWARLLRLQLSERYVYCMRCHTRLRRVFDDFWAGRASLAEVGSRLRAMEIHDSEKEITRVLRELRRTQHAAA